MSKSAFIEFLQNEYNELLQKIKPSAHQYRFLTERQDDGSPHVEVGANGYYFVATERGLELSREIFQSKDELFYQMISLDTFWMAVDFEFKNRVENQDSRRLIFAKQLELLNRVNSIWANRKQLEVAEILQNDPFNDRLMISEKDVFV